MRHLTVIAFILLVVCHFEVVSQPCLPDGITFTTQSQIDSFPINYPGCTEIGGDVTIANGEDVTNIIGLSPITSITGNLFIIQNDSLTDLIGFDNLLSVGQDLRIDFNQSIQTLSGLSSLDTIGGLLSIDSNPSLLHLDDLNSLYRISGDLIIIFNNTLEDLAGISNLNTIGGNLDIGSNPNISSLEGIQSLNSIGGNLYIGNNDNLNDITSLLNLSTIGGRLMILGNDSLSSLSGLDNIAPNSIENLTIQGNDNLATCEVQSICDYLSSPTGGVDIEDNAPGCNSPQEVEEACIVGIIETSDVSKIYTYPNPFTTSTTIQYELTEPTYIQLTIYNHLGEAVEEAVSAYKLPGVHTYVWSAERLSEGMYFAVIRSGDGVSVVKMIKQ